MALSLLETLKSFLSPGSHPNPVSLLVDRHGNLIHRELAAVFTALLVEMSLSDHSLQENEVHEIIAILRNELALSEDASEEVFSTTLESRKHSNTLLPKLTTVAASLNDDQKEEILRLALVVARADERITTEEDRILENLRLQLRITPENARQIRERM
jgi:uncharacterized tellurite resistance protein B-like protein